MPIKITQSNEAPPSGGAYRHYIAGNVYGPDTDPPATPDLERRALREGWAIPWPPPQDEPAAPITTTDPQEGVALSTTAAFTLVPAGPEWTLVRPGAAQGDDEEQHPLITELEPLPGGVHAMNPPQAATEGQIAPAEAPGDTAAPTMERKLRSGTKARKA